MIDAHAHISLMKRREEVIERARKAGIVFLLDVGIDPPSWRSSLELSQKYDFVYSSLGLHPHFASRREVLSELEGLLGEGKVVAIGETGLDLYRKLSPPEDQLSSFRRHIELAIEHDLPLVLHVRNAHKEVLAFLEEWRGRVRGVVHCFSGNLEDAERYLELGFYISVAGTITRPGSHLQEIIKRLPLERLLLETDSPYLTPEPLKGRNEPSFIIHTLKKVSEILKISEEELERRLEENAFELFGAPGDPETDRGGASAP